MQERQLSAAGGAEIMSYAFDWADVLLLCIGLALIAAKARAVQVRNRDLKRLPPDSSGGTPVTSTTSDKVLVALFFIFVLAALCWLWMKLF